MEHLSKPQIELNRELNLIRTKKAFEPSKFINERTNQFLRYLEKFNLKTVVLSISGGVDSACVLGLLKEAQIKANSIPVHPFNEKNGGRIIADVAVIDLMTTSQDLSQYIDDEGNIFCIDPKNQAKFVKVKYCGHEELLIDMLIKGVQKNMQNLNEAKLRCDRQIGQIRKDHLRQLNATPYKVSTPKIFSEHIWDIIFSESVIKII